jgi:hypothetical protein
MEEEIRERWLNELMPKLAQDPNDKVSVPDAPWPPYPLGDLDPVAAVHLPYERISL